VNLVSQGAFEWFVTLITGGVAGSWFVYDAINLARVRKLDGRDPKVHDRRFGYVMGMIIGALGVIGVLRFHGVL
jgi:hypothetical protein